MLGPPGSASPQQAGGRCDQRPACCPGAAAQEAFRRVWACKSQTQRMLFYQPVPVFTTVLVRSRERMARPRPLRLAVSDWHWHRLQFCETALARPARSAVCNCKTSLVLRVISDGMPKRFISCKEKACTCAKTRARRSQVAPVAHSQPRTDHRGANGQDHLQHGERQHHRACVDDLGAIVASHAQVDDIDAQMGQPQRGKRLSHRATCRPNITSRPCHCRVKHPATARYRQPSVAISAPHGRCEHAREPYRCEGICCHGSTPV
ncbi:hypothetical protein RCH10_004975 [Variovorax sp. GrIS 2.14]|jgi:hypothetical protein